MYRSYPASRSPVLWFCLPFREHPFYNVKVKLLSLGHYFHEENLTAFQAYNLLLYPNF